MGSPELTKEEYLRHLEKVAVAAGVTISTPIIPAENDVIVNGIRLHYLDWGGEGPILLFLHGGGLHAHSWDLIAQSFSPDYRCIALDQRGHGRSEWSSSMDYRPADYAADVSQFIQRLSLNKPIVIGTSMGGVNALALATKESSQLNGLVLLDVTLNTGPNAGRKELREFMTGELEVDSIDAIVAMGVSFNPRRDPDMLRTTIKWNVFQLPNNKWTWRYDRRHRQRDDVWSIIVSSRESLTEFLPSIQCPVLLVRGAKSKVVYPEDIKFVSERIPNCTTAEVSGAGHSIHGDNPKETIQVIKRFLETNSLTGK